VDDGRNRWARFSRRALYSADLERSPRPNKKEFISDIVLYFHAFSEEFRLQDKLKDSRFPNLDWGTCPLGTSPLSTKCVSHGHLSHRHASYGHICYRDPHLIGVRLLQRVPYRRIPLRGASHRRASLGASFRMHTLGGACIS